MTRRNPTRLIVVANAGRSGSTYLWNLLSKNRAAGTVFHEDIPVQVSQPRFFNRAYSAEHRGRAMACPNLKGYLDRWAALLEKGDVIETGWTAYSLLPILHDIFHDRLHLVVLHRDPWSVALSRANLGKYHERTWYDPRDEVSPNDPYSIAPEYAALWPEMNHAEKCLFHWYVVYREIDEFINNSDNVPLIELSANSLFHGDGVHQLSWFLEIPLHLIPNLERNAVPKYKLETFPITNEYCAFSRHESINTYAQQRFGYELELGEVERQSEKYRLPDRVMPRMRHAIDYWSLRRRLGQAVRYPFRQ